MTLTRSARRRNGVSLAASLSSSLPDTVDFDQFAKALLAAMTEFRDGNFSVKLPADYPGVAGKIADIFNEVVTVSQRRAMEVTRVCRVVGKEGRLRERMSLPGAYGTRAEELAAFNQLIDDLVWPTAEMARAVGAVAKGDLTQAVSL